MFLLFALEMDTLQTIVSIILAIICFGSLFVKSHIGRYNVSGVNIGFFVGLLFQGYAIYSGSWRYTIGGMILALAISGLFVDSKGIRGFGPAFQVFLLQLGVVGWILSGSWICFVGMFGLMVLAIIFIPTRSRKPDAENQIGKEHQSRDDSMDFLD